MMFSIPKIVPITRFLYYWTGKNLKNDVNCISGGEIPCFHSDL